MSRPALNLLVTLDVLLTEGSVARAARRLRHSPSAMSRALSRLRETTGDPLLVRSGRALVPTPRALELRDPVSRLVRDAEAVLVPQAKLDLGRLVRTFTLRTSDGFVENFGPAISPTSRVAPAPSASGGRPSACRWQPGRCSAVRSSTASAGAPRAGYRRLLAVVGQAGRGRARAARHRGCRRGHRLRSAHADEARE